MAVMFLYDRYRRLFGVRRIGDLENPKVRPISRFSLPRGTVYHYMPINETELGPASDSPVIQAAQRLVFIEHVPDLLSTEGNPRPTFKLLPPMMQQYRRENMGIRPLRDYEAATRDLVNMVVINYSMVGQQYKYMRSALSRWWSWKNMRTTMWKKLNTLTTEHERHHIVPVDLPHSLPALADLRKAERGMTPQVMKVFNSRERLDILDLWIWLGDSRARSPLAALDPAKYHEVDLLIKRETGFITINLGLLNGWRKATPSDVAMESYSPGAGSDNDFDFEDQYQSYVQMELDEGDSLGETELEASMEAPAGLDGKIIQLRFLKMLTKVITQTNPLVAGEEEDTQNDSTVDVQVDENGEVIDEESLLEEEDDRDLQQTITDQTEGSDILIDDVEEELSAELDAPGETSDMGEMTDEDGELIIETGRDKDPVSEVQVVGTANIEHTLTSTIQSKIDELVDKNLYTAAQYRRMQKLAETYKTLPDPYGTGKTVEESLTITDEDLILDETDTYPDSDAVRDKSMQKSTVEQMDSQYVEKVMDKDILNAVMSVQKAGIAVTGYKIEEVKDAVSDYQIHKVQLTPVTGKPSTISFRIPNVDKRGVYISNGQRYRLRTQKSDLPLVKVNSTRVAMTSNYNKLFVERSKRSTFNYGAWIGKQIVAKGLDPADDLITNVKVADVADYTLDLPSIYSIMSSRVLSFESNGQYWFDYNRRDKAKIFKMDRVEAIEKQNPGMVVCGVRGTRHIAVDRNNAFYLINNNNEVSEELGQVEDLLGLASDKAPVELAEVSIFGKVMPIGLVLGYLVGLDRLLDMLRVRYRVVPLGTRLQMGSDEFAIRFLDETLVIDKGNVKASMILSGFHRFHREVKQYSRHSFNTKDVYFTVMEANGIGLRYLRELDLMNAMWVDPITKSLLEWMKEPTEFVPLLMRAVEMLVSYYVPEKVEGVDGLMEGLERAKGYERIPGALYGELIRSIRVYNARSASSTSQVTMKPHEVWVNIVQDPAAALVDDINPIQNLKQKEIITYGGRGGRSSRSMTADSRLYKESDIGFISEATVDSGDVAVITYMSPNANITSVRGTVKGYDRERDGSASVLSTSALISPFSDRDDQ